LRTWMGLPANRVATKLLSTLYVFVIAPSEIMRVQVVASSIARPTSMTAAEIAVTAARLSQAAARLA